MPAASYFDLTSEGRGLAHSVVKRMRDEENPLIVAWVLRDMPTDTPVWIGFMQVLGEILIGHTLNLANKEDAL